MIQKVPMSRVASSSSGPVRQNTSDGTDSWGQWIGRKHYSLEVVQHPIRARMCGFGDKDRRPLAPAAVAKMVVRREDNSIVDPDEVDCSFFLVTVDLWSSDGKHEMNLVLHPTSSDRYVPSAAPKVKRKATGGSSAPASQRSERQSPITAAPTPGNSQSQYPQSTGITPFMSPSTSQYGPQTAYPFPPPQQEPNTFQPIAPYGPPQPEPPTWGYGSSPVERPSSYLFFETSPPFSSHLDYRSPTNTPAASVGYNTAAAGHSTESSWPMESSTRDDAQSSMPYRAWAQDHDYSSVDNSHGPSTGQPQPDPNSHWSSSTDAYGQARYSQDQYGQLPPQHNAPTHQQQTQPPVDTSMYASAQYAQQQHQQQTQQSHYHPQGGYTQPPQEETAPSTLPPLPRHTYTRTLVGPLSANACRLLDEHRKPGIFFLFQDLSIRTEGTFRLRLRLMNIGAPPAPEPGAIRVHTDVSPVLAQTFTKQFTVFSAKRFPGVPDTTALSIALGNQGQKLPLRNRNGSTKQGRKRRHDGSDESGGESDD
ncbi:hypothetical protein K474DRAFT_1585794 [Panus rudis PR-1116 ss-1]|nr:hypothetical protein K474DRAFT_1585794 [Panus rudis PR-1116 ss-1]